MKLGHPEGIHYVACGRCHKRQIDILQTPLPDEDVQGGYKVVCLDCGHSGSGETTIEAINTFERKAKVSE